MKPEKPHSVCPCKGLSSPLGIKRLTDVILALLGLLTLYPLCWLWIAPLIKLSSRGPVLFRQARTGLGGKTFRCIKFRTLAVNPDADTVQVEGDDPRVYPFGGWLRRTALDELPQLWNVLKGEMALVGPRPHMLAHTEAFTEMFPEEYPLRHAARPGITGWAQVNGSRGALLGPEDVRFRLDLDLWYIRNWSPALDCKIFLMTLWESIHPQPVQRKSH